LFRQIGENQDKVPGHAYARLASKIDFLLEGLHLAQILRRRFGGGDGGACGATAGDGVRHRFGGIPSGFPGIKIPQFHFDLLRPLFAPAITVAMLGAIQSLMSAVVSDRMSGTKHNPNVELVGQGVANIMSPLFGGLADTVHESGRGLILCGAREQPARLMHQTEFEEHVGTGNICPSIAVALERAKVLYQDIEQRKLQSVE
jgi:hypothetical protein